MQTVCAHCYNLLNRREQRMACILCTTCEHNWAQGKRPQMRTNLPVWVGVLPAQQGEQGLPTA
ncbi:MAG TPA: hypothetical protein VL381_08380 [Rhodocyclaceae bacterium]|nr:hypothetical protein [Rhodocyclaceae bacterium]